MCGHHDGGPWFPYLLLTAVSRLSLGALVPVSLGTLLAFPVGALAQGTPVPLFGSNCPTHYRGSVGLAHTGQVARSLILSGSSLVSIIFSFSDHSLAERSP